MTPRWPGNRRNHNPETSEAVGHAVPQDPLYFAQLAMGCTNPASICCLEYRENKENTNEIFPGAVHTRRNAAARGTQICRYRSPRPARFVCRYSLECEGLKFPSYPRVSGETTATISDDP